MTDEMKAYWRASAYVRKFDVFAWLLPGFVETYQRLACRLGKPMHFPRSLYGIVRAAIERGDHLKDKSE